jgi:hypothetical protein
VLQRCALHFNGAAKPLSLTAQQMWPSLSFLAGQQHLQHAWTSAVPKEWLWEVCFLA